MEVIVLSGRPQIAIIGYGRDFSLDDESFRVSIPVTSKIIKLDFPLNLFKDFNSLEKYMRGCSKTT